MIGFEEFVRETLLNDILRKEGDVYYVKGSEIKERGLSKSRYNLITKILESEGIEIRYLEEKEFYQSVNEGDKKLGFDLDFLLDTEMESKALSNLDNGKKTGSFPSNEENCELIDTYLNSRSKEDRNRLIEKNIPLVTQIALPLSYSFNIPLEDLESYGYEGLIKAVETISQNNKTKFILQVSKNIYKAILNGIADEKHNFHFNNNLLYDILSVLGNLSVKNDASAEDITLWIKELIGNFGTDDQEDVTDFISINLTLPLEETEDCLFDLYTEHEFDKIINRFSDKEKKIIFYSLTEREKEAILLFFGIEQDNIKNYNDIREAFATEYSVNQIKRSALRKLVNQLRSLNDYYNF